MATGKRQQKNVGKAELRVQTWRRFCLDLFQRHHGITKQTDIAKLIGCSPPRVRDFLQDPARLGKKAVTRIASCFKIPVQTQIFQTWNQLNVRQAGADDEPVRRPKSRRPDYVKSDPDTIFAQLLEETILFGPEQATVDAYFTSVLNRSFVPASVYLSEIESLPATQSDPLKQVFALHKRYRLLTAVGCVNQSVLFDILSRALLILMHPDRIKDNSSEVVVARIVIISDQVTYFCERYTHPNPDFEKRLHGLLSALMELQRLAGTAVQRATVHLKCAQIQSYLGNIASAEKFLAAGLNEAKGTTWEYHAQIAEVIVLRAKGESARALELATTLAGDEALLRDEYHLRYIQLHLIEMTLGIDRFKKPVPNAGTGSDQGDPNSK